MLDEQLARIAGEATGNADGNAALETLLMRHRQTVYLWCFRYVKEHEHALDVSQDVLMTVCQRIDTFQGRSKFTSWLFALTRNRCLNEVQRVRLLVDEDADPEFQAAPQRNPGESLEEKEGEERILELIQSTLDEEEQKAIWLRCFERLPVDEITRLLNLDSDSGARGLLQRARRKLRAVLATE